MKKKIVGLMLGLGLMTTAPVALTGCGDTPPPITIDQMFVRCNFGEMIIQGNNVTLKYSEQIANPENMFYVMGLTSDRTEVFLTNSANTTAGQDGQTQEITYYIDTNISSGIVAVGTYYYNITASNGMTLNLNITVVPGVYDISSFHWNNTDNFIYTGEEQEITLDEWNLPNGVSVTYTGNKATDAGTYTAIAHFNCTDPNYEPIPDISTEWTIKKSTIVLEPMLAGREHEISQKEYYEAVTFGDGVGYFYDRNGGPAIDLENAIDGEIEFSTTYELYGAPGIYEISMGGFTLKEEYADNYELEIRTTEYEVTESLVTITAQYPDEHYEIQDESGNKIDYDNGGISVQFGKYYTISIVLDASHNKSNYTLQCNGSDAEVVNHTYTFRPIYNSYNFWLNNVTENTYYIRCYDEDKTTFIVQSNSHPHGANINNTIDGIWDANSVDRGMVGYVEDKSMSDPMYNYTFVEWKDMTTDERADMSSLSQDMSVYATYTRTYDIYNVEEIPSQVRVNKSGSPVNTETELHYGDVINVTYSVTEGYECTNFSVEGAEKVGTSEYVVRGNITITYTEEIITYSVTDISDNKVGYTFNTYDGGEIPETIGHNTEFILMITLDEAYDESDVKLYASNSATNIVNDSNLLTRLSNGWYVLYPTDDVYFYIYGVVKNTYSVVVYENGTTNKLYETTLEHGDKFTYEVQKPADNTYRYIFATYYLQNGEGYPTAREVTEDLELYAGFNRQYIEYTISCNSPNVTIAKGSAGLTTTDTLHYGDEITIVYNDSEYCELENMTVTGADPTSKPNTYVVTGNVTITVVENDLAESVSNYSHLTFGTNGYVTPASGATITGDVVIPGIVRLANGDIYIVTKVGGFKNNTAITSVTIPSSVTEIGYDAFNGCTALTTVTFGENSVLTTLDNQAFYGCTSLTNMQLPSTLTTIGQYALRSTKCITTLTINGTLSNFGAGAFQYMSSLTSVIIEASYTKDDLQPMMFDHCSNLRTVLIKEGTNITQLPESMFSECKNLESFVVEGENSIVSIGSGFNMITGNNGSKLARFDLGTNTTLKIIGMGVFGSYKGNELTDANFNLGTLESLETIGERAFWGCGKITTLDFSKAKLTSFGKDAFYTCGALTTVQLPSTLKEIGEGAFEGCYSLTSINIPEGVTTISNSAFNSCYSLTNVIIPSTVTAIEGSAFAGCFSIESTITITKDMVVDISAFEESGFRFEVSSDNATYKAVGGALYSYDLSTLYRMAPKHMGETFEIPEGVTTIYEYALSDYVRFYFALEQGVEKPALNIKAITLPSTLVTIGDGAFYYLHTLENLEMPSVVAIETIGEYAFAGCESLTSFIIPSRVTTISPRLFTETGLTEIIIHSGITTIGNDVFDGCESLTRIIVEEGCIITELTEEMVGDVYNNVEIVYNNTTTE